MPLISRNCLRTSSTTSKAALPTDPISLEENKKVNAAPIINPTNTLGWAISIDVRPVASKYVANNELAATAAEPTANPLVRALVVLPTASKSPVTLGAWPFRSAISTMP